MRVDCCCWIEYTYKHRGMISPARSMQQQHRKEGRKQIRTDRLFCDDSQQALLGTHTTHKRPTCWTSQAVRPGIRAHVTFPTDVIGPVSSNLYAPSPLLYTRGIASRPRNALPRYLFSHHKNSPNISDGQYQLGKEKETQRAKSFLLTGQKSARTQ